MLQTTSSTPPTMVGGRVNDPRPFSETWALSAAVHIDRTLGAGSFLSYLFTTSRFRRQLAFLTFALLLGECDLRAQQIGRWDRTAVGRLVRALESGRWSSVAHLLSEFTDGSVQAPAGVITALSKLGDDCLPQSAYRTLYGLLSGRYGPARRNVIHHLTALTPWNIDGAARLHDVFVMPSAKTRLTEGESIDALNASIDIILESVSHASLGGLKGSLRSFDPNLLLTDWIRSSLEKADHLTLPDSTETDVILFRNAQMLREAGLRFRNCLATQIVKSVLAKRVFAEVRGTGALVVAELRTLDDGSLAFTRKEIYGKRNRDLSTEHINAVSAKLRNAGIREILEYSSFPKERTVAQLLNTAGFGFMEFD